MNNVFPLEGTAKIKKKPLPSGVVFRVVKILHSINIRYCSLSARSLLHLASKSIESIIELC